MAKDVPPVPRTALVDPASGRLTQSGQDFLERVLSRVGGPGNNVGWGGQVQVHRNDVDQTGIVDATWTKVNYTTAAIDREEWFDLTNDRYVPKQKGWYMIAAYAAHDSTNTGASDLIRQRLFFNNASVVLQTAKRLHVAETASWIPLMTPVEFNGDTDFIEHYVRIDGAGGNITLLGDTFFTQFTAWRWL